MNLQVSYILRNAVADLARAGVDTPELDAELLLAHVLDKDRTWLMAHPDSSLSADQYAAFLQVLTRRVAREPLAYITGQRWFYDFLLHVSPEALIPRPETEELVARALRWLRDHPDASVADIGTGSGAIALAVARHTPVSTTIYATDNSRLALGVARANASRLGLAHRVTFFQGNLLNALSGPVDMILANLPYVPRPEQHRMMPEVGQYEPAEALFSGQAGLDHLRSLLSQAPDYLNPSGVILLEIGCDQGLVVPEMARSHFPNATIHVFKDLSGHDRIVEIKKQHGD